MPTFKELKYVRKNDRNACTVRVWRSKYLHVFVQRAITDLRRVGIDPINPPDMLDKGWVAGKDQWMDFNLERLPNYERSKAMKFLDRIAIRCKRRIVPVENPLTFRSIKQVIQLTDVNKKLRPGEGNEEIFTWVNFRWMVAFRKEKMERITLIKNLLEVKRRERIQKEGSIEEIKQLNKRGE